MVDKTTYQQWSIPEEKLLPYYSAFLALMNQIDADFYNLDHKIARIDHYNDSLSQAVAQIGSAFKTLIIHKDIPLTENTTVPANIHLVFYREGEVTLGAYNLTINGPMNAPIAQIFDDSGAGSVSFGSGYVEEIYSEFWGAIADGSTDCSSAIASAQAASKKVNFLKGTYIIDTLLALADRTVFEGMGYDTVFKLKNGANQPIIKNAGYGSTWNEWIEIRNIRFDGNKANQTGACSIIDLDQAYFVILDKVYIRNAYTNAVKLTRCNAIWIKNSTLQDSDGANIYADSVQSLSVVDSDIENAGAGKNNIDIHNDHGETNVETAFIAFNHIEGGGGAAVAINEDCQGVDVIGNHIYSLDVKINDTASKNHVVHNTIYNTGTAIDCAVGTSDNIIRPNTFVSCPTEIADLGNNSGAKKVDYDNTDVATSGTGEDTLQTTTIPLKSLGLTGGIKIIAAGTISGANDVKVIKLYFGTDNWTIISAAAGDETDWRIEAEIINTAASAQRITWLGVESDGTITSGYETGTSATAGDVVLKLTGECTHADDTITQTMWMVDQT